MFFIFIFSKLPQILNRVYESMRVNSLQMVVIIRIIFQKFRSSIAYNWIIGILSPIILFEGNLRRSDKIIDKRISSNQNLDQIKYFLKKEDVPKLNKFSDNLMNRILTYMNLRRFYEDGLPLINFYYFLWLTLCL